jgi:NADPH2:quinone reductase
VEKKEGEYVVKDTFGLAQFQSTGKGFYENVVEYLKDGKAIPLKYEVAEGVGLNAEKVNEVLDRYRDGKPVVQTHFRISE